MVIVDAVDFVVDVYSEGHAVQTLVAHAAAEAARVVRLAHGLQDLRDEQPKSSKAKVDCITIPYYKGWKFEMPPGGKVMEKSNRKLYRKNKLLYF